MDIDWKRIDGPGGIGASWESFSGIMGKANTLVTTAIGFSALVCVILLIVSGYGFITSAGDAEKIEKAQKSLTAAIVGLVIVFIAVIIVYFLRDSILQVK